MKRFFNYFTLFEKILWLSSVLIMIFCFIIFKNKEYVYLIGSIIGVTSLMFFSKANPYGQIISIMFCLIYAYISLTFSYYGEAFTYLFMSLPAEIICAVTWFKNLKSKDSVEVNVKIISKKTYFIGIILGLVISFIFYFILKALNTNFLIISTVSVFTSFLASFMSINRSKYYALWYSLNDIVLISLWIYASIDNIKYLSMVICFLAFLANDIYGYINWSKLERKQQQE